LLGIFAIMLVLFLFVPVHQWFNTEIYFQTRESYAAENFFVNHYNWQKPGLVVSDFRTNTYLESKLTTTVYLQTGVPAGYRADAIMYTPQLVGSGLEDYSSVESLSQGERLNLVYNNGFSYVLIR
jgi:hypothetical protein